MVLRPFSRRMFDALLVCLNSDSWPIRDSACVPIGRVLKFLMTMILIIIMIMIMVKIMIMIMMMMMMMVMIMIMIMIIIMVIIMIMIIIIIIVIMIMMMIMIMIIIMIMMMVVMIGATTYYCFTCSFSNHVIFCTRCIYIMRDNVLNN